MQAAPAKAGFSLTYDVVTPESAEDGDVAECGFIAEDLSFREAIELWHSEAPDTVEGVQADCYPIDGLRWITACAAPDFRTGEARSVSLHIPATVTNASKRRIARLLGCYGA